MTHRPTARQAQYLAFIRSFTDRWGMPPSFEEIGRHFGVSSPSVNGMVKTLESKGLLARVPGAARTLRVIVPVDAGEPRARRDADEGLARAVEMASLVIERLVPALKGVDDRQMSAALDAVASAVDVAARAAGATNAQRSDARKDLAKVARAALGITEAGPPRRLWRRRG